MSSLREDLESAFADWPAIPGNPVEADMIGMIDAESCHATFAGRTWQSLGEDDLEAFFWDDHSYLVPEAIVALFPALLRHSLKDFDAMLNSMVAIETSIDFDRLSGLKDALDRGQIECLTRFGAQVKDDIPVMAGVVGRLLDLVRPDSSA